MYVFFGSEMSPSVRRSVGQYVGLSSDSHSWSYRSTCFTWTDLVMQQEAAIKLEKRTSSIIQSLLEGSSANSQYLSIFFINFEQKTQGGLISINSYLWQFFLYSLFNRALCTPSPETLNFCLVFGIHSNFHSLWAVGWLVGGLVGRKFCWGPFLLCYLSPTIISVRRTLWKYLRRLLTAAAWRILNRQINNSNWINKYQYDHEFECKKAYSKEKKKIVLH